MNGKNICKYLKGVRRQIAETNGIELEIPECTFEGECSGTCPRCEAEVKYLEKKLTERRTLAKKIAIIGVAAGMSIAATPDATAQVASDTVSPVTLDTVNVIYVRPEFEIDGTVTSTLTKGKHKRADIIPPMFPGGENALQNYLKKNIIYPEEARRQGIEGTVIIQIRITRTGKVKHARVKTKVHPLLDAEAIRLVNSMPNWRPGARNGHRIRTKRLIYVSFSLNK